MPRNLIGLLAICMATAMHMASDQTPMEKPLGPVSPKGLSAQQAEQVLLLVLKHEGYDLDAISASVNEQEILKRKISNPEARHGTLAYIHGSTPPRYPGYFDLFFSYIDNDNTANYTSIFFEYAVSKLTGDVWEVHQCKRYIFQALQVLQKSIMQQTGRTMTDEQTQRNGLGCTDDASAPTLDLGPVAPQGLSPHQAGEVLKLFLIHDGYKPPIYWEKQISITHKKISFKRTGLYIKQSESHYSEYWGFDLRHANKKAGDFDFYGYYLVSKLTGNILQSHCERYIFPALQRVQESIMKQTGKTMADEKAQREKLESCPDELLY